jgi:Fibronectin type III domain/Pregnancy-associated plasma protein-A
MNISKNILPFLLFWLGANTAFAQTPNTAFCKARQPDAATLQQLRQVLGANIIQHGVDVYVPVSLHIVGKNDGTGFVSQGFALDAFCQLTKDFAPHNIHLYIQDTLRYIRNSAWYEHNDFAGGDAMHQASGVPGTMNCYIVQTAAGACGYAWYGGCIVLKNSCTGEPNHTWSHEAGHYFSLPHTFFGWEDTGINAAQPAPDSINGFQVEKLDGSNCTTAGDYICDTPPDYISNRWTCTNGTSQPMLDPNGQTFSVDGTNYMSYSNDACMSKFTTGQGDQMRTYGLTQLADVMTTTPTTYLPTSVVSNLLPRHNDTVLTTNSAQLTWQRDPNATAYLIEVSLQNTFITVSMSKISTDTTYLLTGLQPNRRYNWRVRAINNEFTCRNPNVVATKFWTAPLVGTENTIAANIGLSAQPNRVERGSTTTVQWNDLNGQSGKAVLRISNAAGQVLQTQTILKNDASELNIDTTNLPTGIHYITLQTEQGLAQCKIVVF